MTFNIKKWFLAMVNMAWEYEFSAESKNVQNCKP